MNVLLVGLGSIAKKHIMALNSIDTSFCIYALRSSINSKSFDTVYNIYTIEELNDKKIDFAIVSNPTAEHKRTIELLLPLQCPLFIEKPIYHKTNIQDIVDKIKEKKILTYVACNLRFLECLNYIKKVIISDKKILNEINVYCGSYLPEWRPNINFRDIYSVNPDMGGGVHIDLIHEIDYLYWLFGMPEETKTVFRSRSSIGIKAYDYANYCLIYNSFCASVVLNYYRKDTKRTLELVFEDETWIVDLRKNIIMSQDKIIFKSDQDIIDTYLDQMNYFVQLVKTNKKTSFNAIEDAYNVLKICLEK